MIYCNLMFKYMYIKNKKGVMNQSKLSLSTKMTQLHFWKRKEALCGFLLTINMGFFVGGWLYSL